MEWIAFFVAGIAAYVVQGWIGMDPSGILSGIIGGIAYYAVKGKNKKGSEEKAMK